MELAAPVKPGRRLLALGGLALVLTACKQDPAPDVAFLLSTLQDARSHKDVRYFEARAAELGLDVVTLAADDDHGKQVAQVEQVLARGAKVLVIQPTDQAAAARYVQLAHEKGAKVVAYDRAIISPDLDYYVSHDSYRIGVLQAEAAIAATGGKGTFLLLAGPVGHAVAGEISRGYENTLAPYVARGDVEVVLQHHPAESSAQARHTVEAALARGALAAVLASTSGMARGAVEAIQARGLSNVFVAGADADAANINLVCQGAQAVEVLKDVQPLARTAAEVAKRLFDRASPKRGAATIALGGRDVPIETVRVEVVTPANVKPLLVDSGFLSADALPACKDRLAVK